MSEHSPDLHADSDGPWIPTQPHAIEAVPAAEYGESLRGQRVVVGKPEFGWRHDLRADDPVTDRDLLMVPVLDEAQWYKAEHDNIEVFAPLVPIEHVFVERIQDSPSTQDSPRPLLDRLVSLDAPPIRPAVPARDVIGLTGRRLVLSTPERDRRGVRAISEPYQREDGDLCVRITDEDAWYRWATDGIPPPGVTCGIHLLWVET